MKNLFKLHLENTILSQSFLVVFLLLNFSHSQSENDLNSQKLKIVIDGLEHVDSLYEKDNDIIFYDSRNWKAYFGSKQITDNKFFKIIGKSEKYHLLIKSTKPYKKLIGGLFAITGGYLVSKSSGYEKNSWRFLLPGILIIHTALAIIDIGNSDKNISYLTAKKLASVYNSKLK